MISGHVTPTDPYKITFLFHKSAFHLVRYEVGKLVTELFPYEECFAL